ncbi:MAG: HDOD domain-containing protein [Planctomycetaceae bacterium]|nr:HDOD domain-containing protein [Planctomycetaceae bacterium]
MPSDSSNPIDWAELRKNAIASIRTDTLPKSIELPALPHAVTEFVQKAARPDFEVKVLAAIVEKDTTLTVELLRYVNSAAFSPRSPVRCVRDAIMLMGINAARLHLMAVGMKAASRAIKSKLINQRNFWNEAMQRALFARGVARKLKLDTGLAFLGGLLQDYLLPVLTNEYDKLYIQFLETESRDGRDLVDWERETFGWDHAAAGAYFAAQWHFPDDLLCAIFFHHALDATLTADQPEFFNLFPVALSGMLPDQMRQAHQGFHELIRVDEQSCAFGLTELCTFVDEEQMKLAEGYEIPNHLTSMLEEARRVIGKTGDVGAGTTAS